MTHIHLNIDICERLTFYHITQFVNCQEAIIFVSRIVYKAKQPVWGDLARRLSERLSPKLEGSLSNLSSLTLCVVILPNKWLVRVRWWAQQNCDKRVDFLQKSFLGIGKLNPILELWTTRNLAQGKSMLAEFRSEQPVHLAAILRVEVIWIDIVWD